MEIAEKIHLTFGELGPERLQSVATMCLEMLNPLRLQLAFCKKDQHRLKIIRSRQKEAQEKIKEMAIKSQYAVILYYQHLDIEYKKAFSFQPSNLPDTPDGTSIFNVKISRPPDDEDQYNGMDHLECALTNAQKVCQESILWTTFYSELEDMERDITEETSLDKPKELSRPSLNGTTVVEDHSCYASDCQHIFKNLKGRKIFEYLQANLVSQKNQLADYTFVFRRMQKDEFIFGDIKEKTFRDFLSRHFEIEIENKLKPEGYNVTDSKERIYSNAISSTH